MLSAVEAAVTATELARKVRSVELRARRTVGELVSGAYHSAFKGQGMEFQEVREYVPGDDTRTIDWNVTARVGRPYIKRYAEERDQTVMLVLDASRSQILRRGLRVQARYRRRDPRHPRVRRCVQQG